MTLINVQVADNNIAEKILWMLSHFKNDGVTIEKKEENQKLKDIEKDILCAFDDIEQGRTRSVRKIA